MEIETCPTCELSLTRTVLYANGWPTDAMVCDECMTVVYENIED